MIRPLTPAAQLLWRHKCPGKCMMAQTLGVVVSRGQDDGEDREQTIKLLKLENEFYRSCVRVRECGAKLREIRGFLLRELLSVESERCADLETELRRATEQWKVRGSLCRAAMHPCGATYRGRNHGVHASSHSTIDTSLSLNRDHTHPHQHTSTAHPHQHTSTAHPLQHTSPLHCGAQS